MLSQIPRHSPLWVDCLGAAGLPYTQIGRLLCSPTCAKGLLYWCANSAFKSVNCNSPTSTVLDGQYFSGAKRWLTSASPMAAGSNQLPIHSAKTAQAYLESLGVKSATAVAQGKGKRDPVSKDCSTSASREQKIVCLQPDRRVTIEVTGVAK